MPIYEYECPTHGVFEVEQRITADALKSCTFENCPQPVRKLISSTSFALKGSGWYATDYGGSKTGAPKIETKTDSKAEAKTDAKAESKTESKSDSKSDAKAESKTETKSDSGGKSDGGTSTGTAAAST